MTNFGVIWLDFFVTFLDGCRNTFYWLQISEFLFRYLSTSQFMLAGIGHLLINTNTANSHVGTHTKDLPHAANSTNFCELWWEYKKFNHAAD